MWPNRRLLDLLEIDLPIIQAPMAGATDWQLAAAVCEAGGLGSLPCGMSNPDHAREQFAKLRERTARPVNMNFFCHAPPDMSNARMAAWRNRLEPYYREYGIDPADPVPNSVRLAFDADWCAMVEDLKPQVVSFHYGLPESVLLSRVKKAGCKVLCSATTVAEARDLERGGVDAVIAQGVEAGGHRGMYLSNDLGTQAGTFALVPQIVDAVSVPVIAAGAVSDARGIAAAFALGASGVQVGTAYLFCPEAIISPLYRAALAEAGARATAITNVFTGRPARALVNRLVREVGPICDHAPDFPLATGAVMPLRTKAEQGGSDDFTWMWAGQAASLGHDMPAGELTRTLARQALAGMRALGGT